jgi:hypothetical protein
VKRISTSNLGVVAPLTLLLLFVDLHAAYSPGRTAPPARWELPFDEVLFVGRPLDPDKILISLVSLPHVRLCCGQAGPGARNLGGRRVA